jgi:ABC-type bacteriocin/lantibiotic exporter with double-glycine peptidase domain
MSVVSLNVPHFRQEFPYSCAAACARMVLAYYGTQFTEAELRRVLGTQPHGTPARAFSNLAALGFDVQLRFTHLGELSTLLATGTPPIVFVNTGFLDYWSSDVAHVLVVVGLDVTTVAVNDPALDAGPRQTALAGFHAAWAANKCLLVAIRPLPAVKQAPEEPEPASK